MADRIALREALSERLPQQSDWLVPTMVQLELAKWLTREVGEDKADQVIAFTQVCQVVPLDTEIALAAADACRTHKLATADAIIFATARARGDAPDLRCAFRRAAGRGRRAEDKRLRSAVRSRWLRISDPRLPVVIWPTAVARTPDAAAQHFCSALPARRGAAGPGLSMRRRSPASPVPSLTVPRISPDVERNRRSKGRPAARSKLQLGQPGRAPVPAHER